jgi:molybdenum transport protein
MTRMADAAMMILSDASLDALLADDAPYGDLTTQALGIGQRPGRIAFAARGDMVLCCAEEAERKLTLSGARPVRRRASGDRLAAGEVFLEAEGPAAALLRAWKVSQTLVEYASGIATATRRIVDAARIVRPDIAVACTRKNFPGTKAVAVKAVLAGGAQMHRLGLSETLLVFPEHRAFLDGPDDFLGRIEAIKRAHPEKRLVAETASVDEALAFAHSGVDVIQLEKLPAEQVGQVVEATRGLSPAPVIAAAGGVNEGNAGAYAAAGCRVLVTSAPYFARPADVKVTIVPA